MKKRHSKLFNQGKYCEIFRIFNKTEENKNEHKTKQWEKTIFNVMKKFLFFFHSKSHCVHYYGTNKMMK